MHATETFCCGSILSLVQIFYFLLFLGIEMYDNEFETKEKKIWTKDKIELQHLSLLGLGWVNPLTVRGGLGKRPATFQFLMSKTELYSSLEGCRFIPLEPEINVPLIFV